MNGWDGYCARFFTTYDLSWEANRLERHTANQHELRPLVEQAFSHLSSDDIQWLRQKLLNEKQKWFVAFAVSVIVPDVPEALFTPLLAAGIYEINPSLNRDFIEPCVKTFGWKRVYSGLVDAFKRGTNFEKSGAINALYWTMGSLDWYSVDEGQTVKVDGGNDPEYREAALEQITLFLQEFIQNDDLDVRRSLMPRLQLRFPSVYPETMRPLVDEVIQTARKHPDAYIRDRVEVQLGNSYTLPALPHRGASNQN